MLKKKKREINLQSQNFVLFYFLRDKSLLSILSLRLPDYSWTLALPPQFLEVICHCIHFDIWAKYPHGLVKTPESITC